ncbi:uncharacterized protein Dwil_GK28300 [Drosophila willistoni]|uniref:uncharacterized protein LOC26530302 isoform X1 n=1 Tax=Drosophila willistoni TaxID=7260 RepID=UPI0007328CCD|nr:uncharacterized protein LOC26530302 isoform X1 [Drosophila willistoni]KRF97946.1 uncharacterized protein Dwil_GK28300 [Drosophila willistoni]
MLAFQKSIYIFVYFLCITEAFRIPRKLKSQYLYENPTTGKVEETILDSDYSRVSEVDWKIFDKNVFTLTSKKPLPFVCKSTASYYKDYGWLNIKQRNDIIKSPRPYLKELRDIMYENANAEMCHQPEMLNVLQFLECQVRRHMRLELEVPNYPVEPK